MLRIAAWMRPTLKRLKQYEGAPVEEMHQATRRALKNLVQLAIGRRVVFAVLAGELYNGDWRDYHARLFIVAQMVVLREAGIPVIAVCGNHDVATLCRLLNTSCVKVVW